MDDIIRKGRAYWLNDEQVDLILEMSATDVDDVPSRRDPLLTLVWPIHLVLWLAASALRAVSR